MAFVNCGGTKKLGTKIIKKLLSSTIKNPNHFLPNVEVYQIQSFKILVRLEFNVCWHDLVVHKLETIGNIEFEELCSIFSYYA